MRVRILALAIAVLACSGCIAPEALGRMKGVGAEQMLAAPSVREAVAKGRTIGSGLAGSLTVLLGFVCWRKATEGESWVRLIQGYLGPTVACAYVIGFIGNETLGIDQWMLKGGLELGREFEPPSPFRHWADGVRLVGTSIQRLQQAVASGDLSAGPQSDEDLAAEAVAVHYASPIGAGWLFWNGVGVWAMALILQLAHAWLIAFYWILTPIVAPTIILPSTRGIFVGWLKAYGSLCLWPALFAIMERVGDALPWATFFANAQVGGQGSLTELVKSVTQGAAMMTIGNILFFFAYLSVPVAAYGLVNAVGRPFRGAIG